METLGLWELPPFRSPMLHYFAGIPMLPPTALARSSRRPSSLLVGVRLLGKVDVGVELILLAEDLPVRSAVGKVHP